MTNLPTDLRMLYEMLLRDDCFLEEHNGIILIHTSPNKIYINITTKILFLLSLFYGKKIPWDFRKLLPAGLQKNVHIKERTSFELKRKLKSGGFKNIRVIFKKNPHYIYLLDDGEKIMKKMILIEKIIPFKHLIYADIYCRADKK